MAEAKLRRLCPEPQARGVSPQGDVKSFFALNIAQPLRMSEDAHPYPQHPRQGEVSSPSRFFSPFVHFAYFVVKHLPIHLPSAPSCLECRRCMQRQTGVRQIFFNPVDPVQKYPAEGRPFIPETVPPRAYQPPVATSNLRPSVSCPGHENLRNPRIE